VNTSNNTNKKRFNKSALLNCICFFAALLIIPIVTDLMPKKTFSENENRSLKEFPEFSAKNVSDRSFMRGFEEYFSEHIAGRDYFISLKTRMDMLQGRTEINGVYILKERMVEKIGEPDYESIDKSIAAMNKFAEDNEVPVFFMLLPTSAGIYSEEIPKNAPNLEQKEFIEYVSNGLSAKISYIDVYAGLSAAKNEYIYYRTDHHWTTLGAYKAYAEAGKRMGYTPLPLSSYDIEHAGFDFKGTFHSKALYGNIEADILALYHSNSGVNPNLSVTEEIGGETKVYDSIYFREFLDKKDKYSVFLGSNQPIVTITNGNPNGGKLLLIKDSYAHCYAPFLKEHYSEITLIDLRYIQMAYNTVINTEDYEQVLILYNVSTFSQDINLRKLGFQE